MTNLTIKCDKVYSLLQENDKIISEQGRSRTICTRQRLKWLFLIVVTGAFVFFAVPFFIKFFTVLYGVMLDFKLSVDNYQQFSIFLWTDAHKPKQVFRIDDYEGFMNSSFNPDHPIKILFHGFSDNGDTLWTNTIKNAYLNTGSYNIISIDWQSSCEAPWYNTAVKNAKLVGQTAAQFMKHIVDFYQLDWKEIHILGASLGAHAAGYFGRFTEGKCGRLTGLDPSGPLFYTAARADRLDTTDAIFVDVIHSAGRWVGNDNIQGHVDFFPNGGRATQPGCVESVDLTCSHFLSWRLFAESIYASHDSDMNKFLVVRCNSHYDFLYGACCRLGEETFIMGQDVSRDLRGTFYLDTRPDYPYALAPYNSTRCSQILI